MNQIISELIKNNDVCVLATVAGAMPHCSLMSYVATEDGRKIYMVTHKNTKKFKNLEVNPEVSLLIDSREMDRGEKRHRAKALTVTGTYEKVKDEPKQGEIRRRLLDRHPHLKDFIEDPQAQFIIIRVRAFQLLEGIADAYFEEVY
ncbi:MAG: pyridoxamine 5'-phosphate oxidase family protein [Syntrophales bacterium]|nr:pyridoxamine 5'-phosphate oxidase family protein [Syntrophales bacterium]MCK9391387.1 pyridoxamine 5'-phosphate oxidase family protein [Syntrophales bacterium]